MDGSNRTRWLITGANGNLGKRLLQNLLLNADTEVGALVRSERAKSQIEELPLEPQQRSRLDVVIADYASKQDLEAAADGVNYCVHLVGIL